MRLERKNLSHPNSPLIFNSKKQPKKLILASRELSELKGIAKTIPNQEIPIDAISLQEAKDSSEIENIITTHDELFLSEMHSEALSKSAKEWQSFIINLKAFTPFMITTDAQAESSIPSTLSKDFLEMLFPSLHKIEFIQKSLNITRQTASRYLKTCDELKILHCLKFGRSNYSINTGLFEALQKGF